MREFIEDQFPKAIAGLHVKLDNINRLLLAQSNNPQTVSDPPSDWDYLHSIADLADFLECSYTTAKRFKRDRRIKFTQEGTKVRFYIPDILDAIEKDDVVGKYIDRFCENHPPANQPPQLEKDPKIYIETELFPDRFMFILIKHQGWRGTVVCSPDLWDNQPEIRALVHEVILAQHDRKPFKIAPII
jgi:hypothetical protein